MNQIVSILYDNYFIIILAWLLAFCGIIANILVLKITLAYSKRSNAVFMKTSGPESSNYLTGQASIGSRSFMILITNLTMADLLAAIYLLILASADLYYRFISINSSNKTTHNTTQIYATWIRHPFCYIARFFSFVSVCQSIGMTSTIAFDRFTNSVYPFTTHLHLTPRLAKIVAVLFWIYSIVLGIISNIFAFITFPPLSTQNYRYHNLCNYDNLRFTLAKSLLIIMISSGTTIYIIMVIFYIIIVYKIRQVRRTNRSMIITDSKEDIQSKVFKMALIIGCTNFITWFPAFITGVVTVIDFHFANENVIFLGTTTIGILILHSNCVINPMIFLYSAYRKLKLFCCN